MENRDVHFVAKCPTCSGVFDGVNASVHLRSKTSSDPEVRFPREWSDGLKDPDRAARLKVIEALVDRCVTRRFERVALTPGGKKSMQRGLIMGKTCGMTATIRWR